MIYSKVIKPVFDVGTALVVLLLLSPLFTVVAIAIRADSQGPVFFKQERLGMNGRVFRIFKFRSMVTDQRKFRKTTEVYKDDPRITKVGEFIRKTSIDELPQLINIICGDMSFIGPRPPLTHFPKNYEDYNDFEKQRFLVKPGISGLAQVRCREVHDWDINIPIDVEYVKNFSLFYDLKLFLTSITFFLKTDNIYRNK